MTVRKPLVIINGQIKNLPSGDTLTVIGDDYSLVADWYLDPAVGSDTNDGLTSLTPLATVAELLRRVRLGGPNPGFTAHILSDCTEDIVINLELQNSAFISFISGDFYGPPATTPIFSGTISSVTNFDATTSTIAIITDSTIPTSFTASGLVGKLARINGGPRDGNQFWIYEDIGSKTARISIPTIQYELTPASLQVGDNYDVYNLIRFGNLVKIDSTNIGYAASINFLHLNIGTPAALHATSVGSATFYDCQINGTDCFGGGEVATGFWNCYNASALRNDMGSIIDLFGGVAFNYQSRNSSKSKLFDVVLGGLGHPTVGSDCIISIDNSYFAAVINPSDGWGFEVYGQLLVQGYLFGKDIPTIGLALHRGGIVLNANFIDFKNPTYYTKQVDDNTVITLDDVFVQANLPSIFPFNTYNTNKIQTEINNAHSLWLLDGVPRTVKLGPGVHTTDIPILVPSGVKVVGSGADVTIIDFRSTDGYDSADNAAFIIQGTISTTKINTTLTNVATGQEFLPPDAPALSVADHGTITALDWIVVDGYNIYPAAQYPITAAGPNNPLTEIFQVKELAGAGNNIIRLVQKVQQHHSLTDHTVKGVDPILNVSISDLTIIGSNGSAASGILADYSSKLKFSNLYFKDLSRACIELRKGTTNVQIDNCRSLGGVNSFCIGSSANSVSIDSLSSVPDGYRFHTNTNAIIRGFIWTLNGSSNWTMTHHRIEHVCQGYSIFGGQNIHMDDIYCRDIDLTALIARENQPLTPANALQVHTGFCGIALDFGSVDLTQDESPSSITITGFTAIDCRITVAVLPDPPARHNAVSFHDCKKLNVTGMHIAGGFSGSPYMTSEGLYMYQDGLSFQDSGGVITGLSIYGCEYAIQSNSSQGIYINDCNISTAPDSGTLPVIALWFNDGTSSLPRFTNLRLQGAIVFGAGFNGAADSLFKLDHCEFDGICYSGPAYITKNKTGATLKGSQVVEFSNTDGNRECIVPTVGASNLGVVVMPSYWDFFLNDGWGFVMPLPAQECNIMLPDGYAANIGDTLISLPGTVYAQVDNSTDAYPIGRVLSTKAASGIATVIAGMSVLDGNRLLPPEDATLLRTDATATQIQNAIELGPVVLQPGTYYIDAPLTQSVTGNLDIQCIGGIAHLVPIFSPIVGLADSETNAMILAQSTIAGSDETTTSAACFEDESTITTVAAPTVGAWYLLRSTAAQLSNIGTGKVIGEPIKIASVSGVGPFTVVLTQKLGQNHGSGSGLRLMSNMVQNVKVKGIDFKCDGGTVANGLYVKGAIGVEIDIQGGGLSRSPFNALYCRGVNFKIYNRGGNNSPVYIDSCVEGIGSFDYDPETILGFSHANGIPRGAFFTGRSSKWKITGKLGYCTSVEVYGFCSSKWECDLEHLDFTDRAARDATLTTGPSASKLGGCLMTNCNGGAQTELPFGSSIRCRMIDCRVPDPTTGNNQGAAYFVDSMAWEVDLEIINDGKSPTTTNAAAIGVIFYDTSSFDHIHVHRLVTKGIQSPIVLWGGGNNIVIDEMHFTALAALNSATTVILFGHTGATESKVHIKHMVLNDVPAHFIADHSTATGINHFSMRGIVIDKLEITNGFSYTDVHMALDVTGSATWARERGDTVEIRKPIVFTASSSSGLLLTSSGHDLPDGTPCYVAARSGGTLPTGLTAGTIYYVVSSDRATANVAFKLSTSLGGSAIAFTDAGSGTLELQPAHLTFCQATSSSPHDKATLVNGAGFGAGLALPVRWNFIALGDGEVRCADASIVLVGDRIVPVVGSYKQVVDNTITTSYSIAQTQKGTAVAGTVQGCRSLPGNANALIGNPVYIKDTDGTIRMTITPSAALTLVVAESVTSVTIGQTQDASATGANWSIYAQQGFAGSVGGMLTLAGGIGGTPGINKAGDVNIELGATVSDVSAKFNITSSGIGTLASYYRYASGYDKFDFQGGMVMSALGGNLNLSAAGSGSFTSAGLFAIESLTGDIYFSSHVSSGTPTYHFRGNADTTIATWSMPHAGANVLTWTEDVTSVSFGQDASSVGTGANWSIRAQKGNVSFVGGTLTLGGGDPGTPGGSSATNDIGGDTIIQLGAQTTGLNTGNLKIKAGSVELLNFKAYTGGANSVHLSNAGYFVLQSNILSLEAVNGIAVITATTDFYFGGSIMHFRTGVSTTALDYTPSSTGANTWTYVAGVTSITESQTAPSATNGADWTRYAQDGYGTNKSGGSLRFGGGRATGSGLKGAVRLNVSGPNNETMIECGEVISGQSYVALARRSDVTSTQLPANTGNGIVYIGDAGTVPTAPPVSGIIITSNSGKGFAVTPGNVYTTWAANGINISTSVPVVDQGVERVLTTDATANVDLATTPNFPNSSVIEIDVVVLVYQTGGAAGSPGDAAKFHHVGGYTCPTTTSALTSGGDEAVTPDRRVGLTTASIRIIASSAAIKIQGTGETNKNLTWMVYWRTRYFSA